MRTININGQQRAVRFTAYTAKIMHTLTGINLFDRRSLALIFKEYDKDVSPTPADFDLIACFIYSALAAGEFPDGADESWRPGFTPENVKNWISLKNGDMFVEIMAAYLDVEVKSLMETEKNLVAP